MNSPALLRVLSGSVDLHCHSGPSPFPRKVNHAEAARDADERLQMRAILVKSHHHSTVMDVLAMRDLLREVRTAVYGGIVLNSQMGGINPSAVAMALRMGGRAVWFPTFSSQRHIDCHPEDNGFPTSSLDLPCLPVDIHGTDGELVPQVFEVLDMVKEADALVTGGHMDPESIRQLLEAGRERGVRRMLVNHPDFVIEANRDQVLEYVRLGAFVEHSIGMYDRRNPDFDWKPKQLLEWIETVGPDRTVLASDLGQQKNPLPVDGFLEVCGALLDLGLPERDLQRVVRDNPAFLLGLDD